MAYESPDELLSELWERVRQVEPPVHEPPGHEWFFALGALFALGGIRALDQEQIRQWESVAQREGQRLNPEGKPIPRPPKGVILGTAGE